MVKKYNVIIQQDEDGMYVGRVPELDGCLSQGETVDELMTNIKEAVELCLEVQKSGKKKSQEQIKFVGVKQIEIA